MQSTTKVKTSLKLKEHCCEWTIDNWQVSSFMKFLCSESFVIPDLKLELRIFLMITDTNLLLLVAIDDPKMLDERNIEAYIVIDNQKVNLANPLRISVHEIPYRALGLGENFLMVRFISSETYRTSNQLVILVQVKYGSSTSDVLVPYDKKMALNNFGQLFSDKKLCDVIFLTNNEEISAHFAVLSAASPYFLAMFNNPITTETQKRVVDFRNDKDVTAKNLRGFFEYIYGTKSISELSDIVSDLLILADKFGVEQLRQTCECYMSESINKENVVDILILSDKYRCELLKKKALSFAKMHIDVVKASGKFNELFKIEDVIRNLL